MSVSGSGCVRVNAGKQKICDFNGTVSSKLLLLSVLLFVCHINSMWLIVNQLLSACVDPGHAATSASVWHSFQRPVSRVFPG